MKETCGLQRLREEVRIVVGSGNKRDDKSTLLNELANKIMSSIYVLRSRVVLWVVGGINRRLVVKG